MRVYLLGVRLEVRSWGLAMEVPILVGLYRELSYAQAFHVCKP